MTAKVFNPLVKQGFDITSNQTNEIVVWNYGAPKPVITGDRVFGDFIEGKTHLVTSFVLNEEKIVLIEVQNWDEGFQEINLSPNVIDVALYSSYYLYVISHSLNGEGQIIESFLNRYSAFYGIYDDVFGTVSITNVVGQYVSCACIDAESNSLFFAGNLGEIKKLNLTTKLFDSDFTANFTGEIRKMIYQDGKILFYRFVSSPWHYYLQMVDSYTGSIVDSFSYSVPYYYSITGLIWTDSIFIIQNDNQAIPKGHLIKLDNTGVTDSNFVEYSSEDLYYSSEILSYSSYIFIFTGTQNVYQIDNYSGDLIYSANSIVSSPIINACIDIYTNNFLVATETSLFLLGDGFSFILQVDSLSTPKPIEFVSSPFGFLLMRSSSSICLCDWTGNLIASITTKSMLSFILSQISGISEGAAGTLLVISPENTISKIEPPSAESVLTHSGIEGSIPYWKSTSTPQS